ncbi:MAG: Glu/Leu/Phe/Val family dehydrogenase [Gammaproteobacteria bacterium]
MAEHSERITDTGWALCDEIGPEKIVHLYRPELNLRAIVVVDNVACGPSIGGARMAPDVSLGECFGLARAMTLKNAAAGLAHGGGKSVIFADPKMPAADKERLIRAFAHAIADIKDYIVGPDMGTDERCMAWVREENARAVGLPAEIGGIPLDELGATGFGLVVAASAAEKYCDVKLSRARVAVQGFGSVGLHAARCFAERGAAVVAVADSGGAIENAGGLDLERLIDHKRAGNSVASFAGGRTLARDDLIGVDCDIWIPAARPDAITADNAARLRARLVVCGANIPATARVEQSLAERGVLVVPDFIANAGGVICASVEYHGGTRTGAFAAIEEKIAANTERMLADARSTGVTPRAAAEALAGARLRKAMSLRRWALH